MALVYVQCPQCQSIEVVQFGKQANGTQRYRCNNRECPRTIFLLQYQDKGRLPAVKQQIVDMTLNGSGVRDIVRGLGASSATVIDVLKKKLGWQNELEEVCLQFGEIGRGIRAKTTTECALLPTCVEVLAECFPFINRLRSEFLGGEGA